MLAQLPLDRSCSRGLSRLGISIAGKIVHAAPKDESEVPPFDSLEDNPQLESSIRLLMRDAMAAALALPTADVQELRFWKGSVVFNAVADAGWLVNKSYFLEVGRSLPSLRRAVRAGIVVESRGDAERSSISFSFLCSVSRAKSRKTRGPWPRPWKTR